MCLRTSWSVMQIENPDFKYMCPILTWLRLSQFSALTCSGYIEICLRMSFNLVISNCQSILYPIYIMHKRLLFPIIGERAKTGEIIWKLVECVFIICSGINYRNRDSIIQNAFALWLCYCFIYGANQYDKNKH